MTDLPNLIARLEGAAEGSRELDEAIWYALGNKPPKVSCEHCGQTTFWFVPTYTASLDDARRYLVPEGWRVWLQQEEPGSAKRYPSLYAADNRAQCYGPGHNSIPIGSPEYAASWTSGEAASLPLALCIAGLKALASLRAQGDGDA